MADTTNQECSAIQVREKTPLASPSDSQFFKMSEVTFRPAMDLYEFGDRYEIHFDLPGTSTEHIDVALADKTLTVQAHVPHRFGGDWTAWRTEYGVGAFRRQIRLGEDIDSERLEARYAGGVLYLTLPKRQEIQPRRIPVSEG